MGRDIRLGTAKVDITPSVPIPLAGFAHRVGCFEGIGRRLYARIWLFEQDADGCERRALIVQADLIWWGPETAGKLKRILQERWGFAPASVILHASHTHSGPQTTGLFTSALGKPDSDYLQVLESSLLAGISEALSNLEAVQVQMGAGVCRIGVHRRKQVDGFIKMAPNPGGPVDTEVRVIRFQTSSGAAKGIFFHYTCHPTVSADNFVSSEFPGAAMETVEEALDGGAVASFLQGCCGDIRPSLIRGDDFYRGTETDVERLGKELSDEVLRVLDGPMKPVPSGLLSWRRHIVQLPFQPRPDAAMLLSLSHKPGVIGEWSALLLNEPTRICEGIPLEMSVLHIADGLSFLAFNAEVVAEYGIFVKNRSRGRVLPLAYSNGMIGYVPTAKQVSEGGYEAKDSAYYFGLPAPFEASLEKLICDGIEYLMIEDEPKESHSVPHEGRGRRKG